MMRVRFPQEVQRQNHMEKKTYIAPALTVVTFRAERGYSLSGTPEGTPRDGFLELMFMDNDNYQETETFSQHSTWTQENSSSFWN